jgi:hypothetical protein
MENFNFFSGRQFFFALTNKMKLPALRRFLLPRLITAALVIIFVSGCFNFYKADTTISPPPEKVSPLVNMPKTFVIHHGTDVFTINSVNIEGDSLTGKYMEDYVFPYKKSSFPKENSTTRYQTKKGDRRLISEIHLYATECLVKLLPGFSRVSLSLKDISRMDIYNQNQGRTALSWFGGFLAVVFTPILFFIIVGALSGASCPYIYVNTGDEFAFEGEIYSGAVYAPLERNDYLTLPHLIAENGTYKLKISNELREIQYTNLTDLVVIDHPDNSEVLIDKYGNYQTSSASQLPSVAVNLSGVNVLDYIKSKDDLVYSGLSSDMDIPLTDGVIMTFDRPESVTTGKLFLRARNSIWLDYVYKNSHELFGGYYDNWTKKQKKSDPDDLKDWALNQHIPLSVYIEKNGEWKFCDYFNMAGPAAFKDDVIVLDLKDTGPGPVKIKLESGTCFWDIDYVALDCSLNLPVELKEIPLQKAVAENEKDVTELLKNDDLKYYVQNETSGLADLSFQAPEANGSKRTVILHSKGHYDILSDGKGLPKIKKLKDLQKPGAFTEYSRDLLRTEIDKLHSYK